MDESIGPSAPFEEVAPERDSSDGSESGTIRFSLKFGFRKGNAWLAYHRLAGAPLDLFFYQLHRRAPFHAFLRVHGVPYPDCSLPQRREAF